LNFVFAPWLNALGVNFGPPEGWQSWHGGGSPNSFQRP
jgi:hypothetical protein